MKKAFFSLFCLLLAFNLSAATISKPVATVNLIRNEVITRTELDNELQNYKDQGYQDVTESDVLEALINEKVFLQGAERDGFILDSRTVDSLYNSQRQALEAQYQTTISDEEFDDFITEQYGSVDAFKESLKNQAIMQNYVMAMKSDIVQDVQDPTDSEIRSWYRQNQTSVFAQGELQRVSVISISKTGDEKTDSANKVILDKVMEDLRANRITFEKAVQQYSDDENTKNKGGDAGWVVDSPVNRMSVGDDFIDRVMNLDIGEFDGVIETPSDYAIAKVTAYMPAKILSLDDPITPDDTITVREYIRQGLTYQNSQIAFVNAYQSLINDLLGEAKINRLLK